MRWSKHYGGVSVIKGWRVMAIERRPHRSLSGHVPAEFSTQCAAA
ncbi:hypothetical protein [Thalassoglobus polymorphus]|nr:hypothetical protein [Thalassoglobus polymorphus]